MTYAAGEETIITMTILTTGRIMEIIAMIICKFYSELKTSLIFLSL